GLPACPDRGQAREPVLPRYGFRGLGDDRGFLLARGLWPHDIDTPLEVGAIIDTDAGGLDVANQASLVADGDLFAHLDIAFHRPHNHDLTRFNIGAHFAMRADRERTLRLQHTFDLAIHHQFFAAAYFAFDLHGWPDDGGHSRRLRFDAHLGRLRSGHAY